MTLLLRNAHEIPRETIFCQEKQGYHFHHLGNGKQGQHVFLRVHHVRVVRRLAPLWARRGGVYETLLSGMIIRMIALSAIF